MNSLKKKILIITTVTAPGGVDTYILTLTREAKRRNWMINVLMDNNKGSDRLFKKLTNENIFVRRKGLYHKLNGNALIKERTLLTIEEFNPNIIHVVCGSPKSALGPREVAIEKNIPLFFTETYVNPFFNFDKKTYHRIKRVYQCAKKVITMGDENKYLLINKYGFPKNKIIAIQNSVKVPQKEDIKKLCIKNKYRLLSIGRFVNQKGFDILIKAISLLENIIKEKIHLTIIGEGPDLKFLQKLVFKNKLENYISFTGWEDDLEKRMTNYDLFIIPSRFEGQPFALLEAMSYGIPSIATNVSGIPEALGKGQYGYLIPPNDPIALAYYIEKFINNPNDLFQKAKNGINGIRLQHNIEKNFDILFNLWEKEL